MFSKLFHSPIIKKLEKWGEKLLKQHWGHLNDQKPKWKEWTSIATRMKIFSNFALCAHCWCLKIIFKFSYFCFSVPQCLRQILSWYFVYFPLVLGTRFLIRKWYGNKFMLWTRALPLNQANLCKQRTLRRTVFGSGHDPNAFHCHASLWR